MGDKMGGPACRHVQRDESAAPVPPAGAATWAPLGAARAGVPGSSPQASPLPSGRPDGWQGRRDSRSAPLPGTEVSVRKSPATGCGAVGRAARGPGGRDRVDGGGRPGWPAPASQPLPPGLLRALGHIRREPPSAAGPPTRRAALGNPAPRGPDRPAPGHVPPSQAPGSKPRWDALPSFFQEEQS